MASTRRRLADLYMVGKEVTFDDGTGDPLTVFVRKLNPVEHETAVKNANAARSKAHAARNQTESAEYQDLYAGVLDFDRKGLVIYLTEDERMNRSPVLEAELAADEPWSKDDYLDGLKDAWAQGLEAKYDENPDDEEAAPVHAELERFKAVVAEAVDAHITGFTRDLQALSDDALRSRAVDKFLTVAASLAWLAEFRRCEVWLSVREMDKRTRMFDDRSEVDELPMEVYSGLVNAYAELSVDPMEGKDSRETDNSSDSSEQPANLATAEDSGPVIVSR